MKIIEDNRLGKIEITQCVLDNMNEDIAEEIFKNIVPIRVEYLFYKNTIEIIGYSKKFKKVKEGSKCYDYRVIIEQEKNIVDFEIVKM